MQILDKLYELISGVVLLFLVLLLDSQAGPDVMPGLNPEQVVDDENHESNHKIHRRLEEGCPECHRASCDDDRKSQTEGKCECEKGYDQLWDSYHRYEALKQND